jgi:hypothetical protein
VWIQLTLSGPLSERFEDQAELEVFEVTQAPMDQLRGTAGGTERPIRALDKRRLQSTHRGVSRHAGARHSTANDQDIKGFGRQFIETTSPIRYGVGRETFVA